MVTERLTGLTYADLEAFPEDNFRRELIDGELVVTAAPATRHQRAVLELGAALLAHTKAHGGAVYIAPPMCSSPTPTWSSRTSCTSTRTR